MSYYSETITTPTGTTSDAPTQTWMKISPGVIHQVKVFFPPGCQQVAHCRMLQGLHQIYPTDTGDFDTSVDFKDYLEVKQGYTNIMIETWNTGNNQHKITVELGVMKEWQLTSFIAISKLNTTIKTLIKLVSDAVRSMIKKER
jgi:hypothetical protein